MEASNRPSPLRRPTATIVATVIGNWLEFFDFGVYAFFAVMIGKAFFPVESPIGRLLLSVGAFGVGFLMRPLGAVLLGAYADRAGRKAALMVTIFSMAVGTALIGLTPTYATIGIAAPILVVIARLIQGFSAGGEVGAATSYLVEIAPPGKRGLYGSLQSATQALASVSGALMGFVLSLVMTDDALARWGFRIPFLFGILIAPVGIAIRRHLTETVDAHAATRTNTELLRTLFAAEHRHNIVNGLLTIVGSTISSYIFGHYMTSYALTVLHMSTRIAMLVSLFAGVAALLGALFGGWLSDRHGRRWVMLVPRVLVALAVYPVFAIITRDQNPVTLITLVALITFVHATSAGVLVLALPECFPRAIRSLGVSVVYAAGVTIFGGTAQVIVTWLIEVTHDPMSPTWYLILSNLVSVVGCYLLRVPEPHVELEEHHAPRPNPAYSGAHLR